MSNFAKELYAAMLKERFGEWDDVTKIPRPSDMEALIDQALKELVDVAEAALESDRHWGQNETWKALDTALDKFRTKETG